MTCRPATCDPSPPPPPLSAAILAGGLSTRMGEDKALLRLVPGGPTLVERVVAAVGAVAADVFLVANDQRLDFLGLRTVPDAVPGGAALGGIYSAVVAAAHDHCLVVACDMPFLSPPLLRAMALEPRDYDVLAPFLPVAASRQGVGGGVYETLHAVYGRVAVPAMRRQLDAGRLKVIGFFPEVRVRPFPAEVIRRFDPALRSFFNANTPERFAEAREILARGEAPEGDGGVTGT